MPDEFDPDTFTESMTTAVRMWLAGEDGEPPGAFLAQKYGRAEARRVVLDADEETGHTSAAPKLLWAWFADRLTVDPGHPGPFGDLAFSLINAALDLADWEAIAAEIRAE